MQDSSAAGNEAADAARRLEAALERIAQLAPRTQDSAAAGDSGPDASEVAARLDQIIMQLRGVLDGSPAVSQS